MKKSKIASQGSQVSFKVPQEKIASMGNKIGAQGAAKIPLPTGLDKMKIKIAKRMKKIG